MIPPSCMFIFFALFKAVRRRTLSLLLSCGSIWLIFRRVDKMINRMYGGKERRRKQVAPRFHFKTARSTEERFDG